MKKQILFLIGLIAANVLLAQVPQGISHQAVIRDANNELVANSQIGIQASILQGSAEGEAVYVETHTPMSNSNGLITYIIGDGAVESGVFAEIDWSAGPYFLKTEADPMGGTDYTITGVTQFHSVPYALHSVTAETLKDGLHPGEMKYWDGAAWVPVEPGEHRQILRLCNGIPTWGDCEPLYGETVIDIDNNVYQTIIIGNQEWMAENLRVTRYNNEEDIPTDLNEEDWVDTTEGACAIYNNDDDMLPAYGKLYNWYAVADTRGLCPEGWSVPSDDDWTALVDYVVSQGFSNSDVTNGAGNALKSCRQVNSPLGGECNTSIHPRWNLHGTHSGFDEFGFSALPGGGRWSNGNFAALGDHGYWWSATEYSGTNALSRSIRNDYGGVHRFSSFKSLGFSVRCFRDIPEEPTLYNLNLDVSPTGAGTVTGADHYEAGEQVNITATANQGWEFVNWTGDTEHLDDADLAEAVVTMPTDNVTLTAVFQQSEDPEPGTVTDIDNNMYQTVIIGNQEWMAEKLRVTRYNNEDDIPTGLSDTAWENTTEGAYAIYPHEGGEWDDGPIEGIDSDEEMVAAYGKLYNWYAVDDERGLCPEGWNVPSDADWTALVNYVVSQGFPDNLFNPNGAGNALKSCQQVGHPDGGDCDTSEHPRWNSDGTHSGFDEFGFSALPGGRRWSHGSFDDVGYYGLWWSATESSGTFAWYRNMNSISGNVGRSDRSKSHGFSVRCFRDLD